MSELKLPEGVSVPELSYGEDHDQVVVSVVATRATVEESDESEAAEGGAAEGEAPAED